MGFESESGAAALLGTIIHKVCEIYSRLSMIHHRQDSKYWNLEFLWRICYNFYAKKEPNIIGLITEKKIKTALLGMIELLSSQYSPIRDNTIFLEQYYRIPLKEKRFRMDNGEYLHITGRIDRCDEINSETLEILDYKSGNRSSWLDNSKEKMNSSDLRKKIQPRLYYLAARKLWPQYKTILCTFHYITDGGPIQCLFDDSDIEETLKMVQDRFNEIKNNNSPIRNLGWKCRFCSFHASGLCENIHREILDTSYAFVENKYVTLNVLRSKK